MNCLKCDSQTSNPRFCSRSCSAAFNNAASPKRLLVERSCPKCGVSLGVVKCDDIRLCGDCRKGRRSWSEWEKTTLDQARSTGNANAGSRYPYIRIHARKKWIALGNSMSCEECGYSHHIDVCHIKDVSSYDPSTLIGVINDLSNLVGLCKNHHWEFDNGFLRVRGVLKPKKTKSA